MRSAGTHERGVSAAAAVDRGLWISSKLGLEVSFQTIGRHVQTTICRLSGKMGELSNGFGKGIGSQSTASAIFEALEHHFTIFSKVWTIDSYREVDFDTHDARIGNGCPDLKRIIKGQPVSFSFTNFSSVEGSSEILEFPTFLTDPGFEPTEVFEAQVLRQFALKRYSTNSGFASGLSAGEATLHGILEVIERDAIGIELLRTVVRRESYPVRELPVEALPETVRQICVQVCQETSAEIKLWDFTTDNSVPVILAALRNSPLQDGQYFGSGASLSLGYAIERATLEALQRFHLHQISKLSRPFASTKPTERLPTYFRCLLEKGIFGYGGGWTTVDYHERHKNALCLSTEGQVAYLAKLLMSQGHDIFQRSLFAQTLHVGQVVAPSLERFHLVARGVPVAPGARGRSILDRT